MNARDRKIISELQKTSLTMVNLASEDPTFIFDSMLNPHNDAGLYWRTLRTLKTELQSVTSEQWCIIQESRDWDKMSLYFKDWSACRFALLKLELAGVARYFRLVDMVDSARQYACIRSYINSATAAA